MQIHNSVQLEIEHLLYELTACVNELQGFRRQLSIDNIQQADLSLQKLHALITNVHYQSNPVRLIVV